MFKVQCCMIKKHEQKLYEGWKEMKQACSMECIILVSKKITAQMSWEKLYKNVQERRVSWYRHVMHIEDDSWEQKCQETQIERTCVRGKLRKTKGKMNLMTDTTKNCNKVKMCWRKTVQPMQTQKNKCKMMKEAMNVTAK